MPKTQKKKKKKKRRELRLNIYWDSSLNDPILAISGEYMATKIKKSQCMEIDRD